MDFGLEFSDRLLEDVSRRVDKVEAGIERLDQNMDMLHRKLDMLDRKLEAGIERLDQNMDVLHRRIGNLVSAPFLNGVRIAREVFELPCECNDGDQRRFREQRLEVAISELDRARSLLHEDFDTPGNQFSIDMIQALCARQISSSFHEKLHNN